MTCHGCAKRKKFLYLALATVAAQATNAARIISETISRPKR
jgi:hypothetical protein